MFEIRSAFGIEIQGLTKQYKDVTAVDNLNLGIPSGELFGLLGPNGSGKTTTINCLSGLVKPTKGKMKVAGFDVESEIQKVRAVLGVSPQETSVYSHLSGRENIELFGSLYSIPKEELKHNTEYLLEKVGLVEDAKRRVGRYSGGMKRMTHQMEGKKPRSIWALTIIQLVLSVIAIPSGIVLLADPSGAMIGAQFILPLLHQPLPFLQDFTIVGIFLLVVYGLLPIGLSYSILTRKRLAWELTILLGVTEIVWIVAEISMFYSLGFIFFYPLVIGMGTLTIVLCLLPSTRTFFFEIRTTGRGKISHG
jgi:ABC-type cobalamin transport system ATPase subunit